MMDYSFNVDHAVKYGTENAIMIRFFQFWISTNLANKINNFDNRTWTYNTQSALAELMPFWSVKQIRRIMSSLISNNVLITGNYNKMKNDQTLWYAFENESDFIPLKSVKSPEIANSPNGQMQKPKRANDNCPNGQTITSYIPIINKYNLPVDTVVSFVQYRKDIKSKMTDRAVELFCMELSKLVSDGYSAEELVNTAMLSGWKTVYPSGNKSKSANNPNAKPMRVLLAGEGYQP